MQDFEFFKNYVEAAVRSLRFPQSPAGLFEPIEYAMADGGKRLRPILTLAACTALGGTLEQARNQALGIEMFHNFTLLHDDLMDRADTRRGKPTVHVRWNPSTAILSGDAMLTIASMLVCGCEDEKLREVLELFNRTAMQVYEGQQYDMDFETIERVSIEEYTKMIMLKTSVLFGCACQTGAIMAGAGAREQRLFYEFGLRLGLAFQLQDDYLDSYGESKTFGKKIGGDILNDKKTWLMVTAIALDSQGRLRGLIGNKEIEDQKKIASVKKIYDDLQVGTLCQEKIREYLQGALEKLEELRLAPEAGEFFKAIALGTIGRKN